MTNHQSNEYTKMLVMGDSGTGKTGGLASLVADGYKLRILDYDNGLDILAQLIKRDDPSKLANVDYETLRDKTKASPQGPIPDGMPSAFVNGMKLLDKWTDGTKPAEWGPQTIFVLDSLTFLANSAYAWAKSMNPGAKEPRTWFYGAQQAVESVLALLSGESFRTNVIVMAHVRYQERQDGSVKGFPTSIGNALGPTIPAYFNSIALAQSSGMGTSVKRTIQTVPTAFIDLKNPAPFKMAPTLPLETGLADFFRTVRS